jgi:hypothetical protein
MVVVASAWAGKAKTLTSAVLGNGQSIRRFDDSLARDFSIAESKLVVF